MKPAVGDLDPFHIVTYYPTDGKMPAGGECSCRRFRIKRRVGERDLHFFDRAHNAYYRHLVSEYFPPPGPIGAKR